MTKRFPALGLLALTAIAGAQTEIQVPDGGYVSSSTHCPQPTHRFKGDVSRTPFVS